MCIAFQSYTRSFKPQCDSMDAVQLAIHYMSYLQQDYGISCSGGHGSTDLHLGCYSTVAFRQELSYIQFHFV